MELSRLFRLLLSILLLNFCRDSDGFAFRSARSLSQVYFSFTVCGFVRIYKILIMRQKKRKTVIESDEKSQSPEDR